MVAKERTILKELRKAGLSVETKRCTSHRFNNQKEFSYAVSLGEKPLSANVLETASACAKKHRMQAFSGNSENGLLILIPTVRIHRIKVALQNVQKAIREMSPYLKGDADLVRFDEDMKEMIASYDCLKTASPLDAGNVQEASIQLILEQVVDLRQKLVKIAHLFKVPLHTHFTLLPSHIEPLYLHLQEADALAIVLLESATGVRIKA